MTQFFTQIMHKFGYKRISDGHVASGYMHMRFTWILHAKNHLNPQRRTQIIIDFRSRNALKTVIT